MRGVYRHEGIDIAVNGTTMTKQYEISFNAVKKGVKISMHLDNIHKISIKYLLCLIARQAAVSAQRTKRLPSFKKPKCIHIETPGEVSSKLANQNPLFRG